jgi:nitrate reductase gamma subunit
MSSGGTAPEPHPGPSSARRHRRTRYRRWLIIAGVLILAGIVLLFVGTLSDEPNPASAPGDGSDETWYATAAIVMGALSSLAGVIAAVTGLITALTQRRVVNEEIRAQYRLRQQPSGGNDHVERRDSGYL